MPCWGGDRRRTAMVDSTPVRGRRPRAIPRGLVGMLALILAVEGFVSRGESDALTNEVVASWRHAGRAAGREATRSEILCFGDSRMLHGVLPKLMGQRT